MSEPLSSNEIEDVLSSVRRLVSPDARPRPMSRDLAADRLILTSSLRIVAEQPPTGPAVIKLEPVKKKARAGGKRSTTAEAVAEGGAEIMTPAKPASARRAPRDAAPSNLMEIALGAEEAVVVPAEPEEAPVAIEVTAPAPSKTSRRSKPAGAEATSDDGRPKAKSKTSAKSAKAGTATRAKKPAKTVAEPAVLAMPMVDETDPSHAFPEGLSASEDQALVPGFAEDPVVLLQDLQPPPPAVATEGPVAAEPGPAPVLTDREGNPISLLDEDDLIHLLRRIIREELQGTLGEKITRNVRKLVRAEINRALTEQTLD